MGRLIDAAAALAGFRARPPLPRSTQAPPGAQYTSQYYAPGQPIQSDWDGAGLIRRGYQRTMYAYRCIDKIATSIAGQPFQAGNAVSRKARSTAPLARLLGPAPGGPNKVWSAAMLWRFWVASYLIMGKFAAVKEFDAAGRVVGLWPLMAQHLKPKMANPNSTSPDYFDGFEYGTKGERGYQEFTNEQVLYRWRPAMHDFRQPESPLQFAAHDVNVAQLIAQFDAAFLQNGGIPAHLVIHEPFENREERKAFRNQFRGRFGGARNAGKTLFAEREIEAGEGTTGTVPDPVNVITLGRAQKDAEMSVLRDSKVQDMCVAFGVPLSKLGDSTRSKFTNMQMDDQNFWETCRQHMREMEDHINLALAPAWGGEDVGWFDVSDVPALAPRSSYGDAATVVALVNAGLLLADEWREDVGLGPLPETADPQPEADLPTDDAKTGESGSGGGEPTQKPASASNVVPIRRADPLVGVLRSQIESWRGEIRGELDRRLSGGRGRRTQVRAQEDIRTAFDADHWRARAVATFGPALRALGAMEIDRYSEDITAAVLEQLDDGFNLDLDEWTDTDRYVGSVPAEVVQQALLALADGSLTPDQAIAQLGS